jgi:hypothetical protein
VTAEGGESVGRKDVARAVVGIIILGVGLAYAVATLLTYSDHVSGFFRHGLFDVILAVTPFVVGTAGTYFLGSAVGVRKRRVLKVAAGVLLLFLTGLFFYAFFLEPAQNVSGIWGLGVEPELLKSYVWLTEAYLCIGGFTVGLGVRRHRPITAATEAAVAGQLGPDERIVATDGPLCATDTRLVRLEPTGALASLAYSDVGSIGVTRKARTFELWVAALMIVAGFWGIGATYMLPIRVLVHFVVLMVLGIALAVFANKKRQECYHLDLSEKERMHWVDWEVETGGDPEPVVRAVQAELRVNAKP